MSFLVTEEDKSILNEAFALIEACSGENSPVSVETTDDSSGLDENVPLIQDLIDSHSLDLLQMPTATELHKPIAGSRSLSYQQQGDEAAESSGKTTKKRRVRSAATSSTALQRRKRAELASLRDQVEELQDVLAHLKRSGSSPSSLEPTSGVLIVDEKPKQSQWHSHAIEQYRMRLQAEKANRQLKVILKNHNKVREALGGVLQKRSVLFGMEYLTKNDAPSYGGVLSDINHVDAWMLNLEDTSERLYRSARSIFEAMHRTPSVNASTQCRFDERRKTKVIVFETTTPMNCSLQDASDFLWRDFQTDRTPGVKPNTLQKKTVLLMSSNQGTIKAEKLHFLRKYQDADQTLVSWADIMVLPTKRELHFRTEGLVLLTRSDTDPNRTVSHSHLKLYLDSCNPTCSVQQEDLAYAQDIVLGAMAMKLRMYWQSFQNMLLDGVDLVSKQRIPA